jgi:hypothetical protein
LINKPVLKPVYFSVVTRYNTFLLSFLGILKMTKRTETSVKLRKCSKCSQLFVGVEEGLCLPCLKDETYYYKTRKKGEPKKYMEYSELLKQWRARKRECISWRKDALKISQVMAIQRQLEFEKSILLAVVTAMDIDLDVVARFCSEIKELKEQNVRLETRVRIAEQRLNTPYVHYRHTDNVKIPQDHWRRLVQLVHPDKHSNSKVSTEVMQWLLKNKP